MTTFSVFLNAGLRQVIIAQADTGPASHEGFTEVGSFDHDIDPENAVVLGNHKDLSQNGDHIFVAKAKEIIEDLNNHEAAVEKFGTLDYKTLTYLDRASNAPIHNSDADMSTDALPESEDDTAPDTSSQKGGTDSATGEDGKDKAANGKQDKGA